MWIREDVDVAAAPAISARGRTVWLELLAVEGDTAVAPSSWMRVCIRQRVEWAYSTHLRARALLGGREKFPPASQIGVLP